MAKVVITIEDDGKVGVDVTADFEPTLIVKSPTPAQLLGMQCLAAMHKLGGGEVEVDGNDDDEG